MTEVKSCISYLRSQWAQPEQKDYLCLSRVCRLAERTDFGVLEIQGPYESHNKCQWNYTGKKWRPTIKGNSILIHALEPCEWIVELKNY